MQLVKLNLAILIFELFRCSTVFAQPSVPRLSTNCCIKHTLSELSYLSPNELNRISSNLSRLSDSGETAVLYDINDWKAKVTTWYEQSTNFNRDCIKGVFSQFIAYKDKEEKTHMILTPPLNYELATLIKHEEDLKAVVEWIDCEATVFEMGWISFGLFEVMPYVQYGSNFSGSNVPKFQITNYNVDEIYRATKHSEVFFTTNFYEMQEFLEEAGFSEDEILMNEYNPQNIYLTWDRIIYLSPNYPEPSDDFFRAGIYTAQRTMPGSGQWFERDKGKPYFNLAEGRKQHLVRFDKEQEKGIITRSGIKINTDGGIFVFDCLNKMYLGSEPAVLNHSQFLGGASVLLAGEVFVKDGVIKVMNNRSGHYQPTAGHLRNARDFLASLYGIQLFGPYKKAGTDYFELRDVDCSSPKDLRLQQREVDNQQYIDASWSNDGGNSNFEIEVTFNSMIHSEMEVSAKSASLGPFTEPGLYWVNVRSICQDGSTTDKISDAIKFTEENFQNTTVHPNPSSGDVFLQWNKIAGPPDGSLFMEVINSSGISVWSGQIENTWAFDNFRVPLTNQPSGVYTIIIRSMNFTEIKRIIIQD